MNVKTYTPLPALFLVAIAPVFAASSELTERLDAATKVVNEVMATPEQAIPEDLLRDARCAVVVPSLKKGAFIVGAKYGKGFITCKAPGSSAWSAPGAVRIEGGSFGFQIGGSETDVVLLVMNDKGVNSVLESQFTMGGEGEVAAGPVGRHASAQTDAKFTAGILSWSRSRGVFAGVSLAGATLREDLDDNADLYGTRVTNKELAKGTHAVPPAARPFLQSLTVSNSADRQVK